MKLRDYIDRNNKEISLKFRNILNLKELATLFEECKFPMIILLVKFQ